MPHRAKDRVYAAFQGIPNGYRYRDGGIYLVSRMLRHGVFEATVLKMEKEKNVLQDVVRNRIKKIGEECNLRELL